MTPAHEELRKELLDLRLQMQALRHGPRRRLAAVALLVGGLVLGLLTAHLVLTPGPAQAQDDEGKVKGKVITCNALQIVGPNNKTMAALSFDADGGALVMFGKEGAQRVFLGVGPKAGGGLLELRDTGKKLRVQLMANDDGGVIEKQ